MPSLDIRNVEGDCKVPVQDALLAHYSSVEVRLRKHPKTPEKTIEIPIVTPEHIVPNKKLYLCPLPKILRFVALHENLTVEQVAGRSRRKMFVRPRQLAMYLMHAVAKKSYPQIGQKFGGKDHTTVIHACKATLRRASLDPQFATRLQWYVEQVREMVA